ncbi:hypothetical protein L798_05527 [Zootermopsis nevadensis]|uniref:Uncharacterized protein n=1 Tax=Zootermopsis nevadensis TaxID=136037 RepID=A0A067RBI9_ZOONE|nr:hypothetical protein L798_05527 [Zootermopsis nevadensis]
MQTRDWPSTIHAPWARTTVPPHCVACTHPSFAVVSTCFSSWSAFFFLATSSSLHGLDDVAVSSKIDSGQSGRLISTTLFKDFAQPSP